MSAETAHGMSAAGQPPADLAPVIDDLAAAYATRRVTVVGLIFSKPSSAVTGLADAFRIRKDR